MNGEREDSLEAALARVSKTKARLWVTFWVVSMAFVLSSALVVWLLVQNQTIQDENMWMKTDLSLVRQELSRGQDREKEWQKHTKPYYLSYEDRNGQVPFLILEDMGDVQAARERLLEYIPSKLPAVIADFCASSR